jgi:hypothetical protein
MIERNIYEYFNADSDPKLQQSVDGINWENIPRILVENDRRVRTEQSNQEVQFPKAVQTSVSIMPQYPNTTNDLEQGARQMDMYDMWKPVPL